MMSCNSTYFALPFTSSRETVSWLYDVIDMGDMGFGYNYSDISQEEEEISNRQVIKVVAVMLLVMVALVGNLLVIFSVFCNKAMR
jgi:hypothetical protein